MNQAFKSSELNKFANEFKKLPSKEVERYQWFFQDKPEPLIVWIIPSGQKNFYHVISEDPFDTPNVYKFLHRSDILLDFGIELKEQK